MSERVKITEVPSDYFKHEYFAERPPSERLINQKLNLRGLNMMQHWKDSLKEYLAADYRDYLSD
jgi:dTDP-4-dehydrorhamnose reductase